MSASLILAKMEASAEMCLTALSAAVPQTTRDKRAPKMSMSVVKRLGRAGMERHVGTQTEVSTAFVYQVGCNFIAIFLLKPFSSC